MKLIRNLLLLLLLVFIAIPPLFLVLAIEKTPSVKETEIINTEGIVRAKYLAKRTINQLLTYGGAGPVSVFMSEEDMNSLMAIMARALHRMEGRVTIANSEFHAAVTLRIPRNPLGEFINMHMWVYPSDSGKGMFRASIGRIRIPGNVAGFILRIAGNILLGDDNGTVAVNSVKEVAISQDTIIVHMRPIPDIREREEKILKRLNTVLNAIPLTAQPAVVRVYYQKLTEVENGAQAGQTVSLAYLTGPLFELAALRSPGGDPAEENKAALLALAIYAGDSRIEKFVGAVRTGELRGHRMKFRRILLGGREDLMLHFVISSALEIITESGITYAIGEFKELLDARQGGSGFSFVDLAADMAGKRFADGATNSDTAPRFQAVLAGRTSERHFFPDVSSLPEDITRSEFERIYENVESEKYLSVVMAIEERISRLPVHTSD